MVVDCLWTKKIWSLLHAVVSITANAHRRINYNQIAFTVADNAAAASDRHNDIALYIKIYCARAQL